MRYKCGSGRVDNFVYTTGRVGSGPEKSDPWSTRTCSLFICILVDVADTMCILCCAPFRPFTLYTDCVIRISSRRIQCERASQRLLCDWMSTLCFIGVVILGLILSILGRLIRVTVNSKETSWHNLNCSIYRWASKMAVKATCQWIMPLFLLTNWWIYVVYLENYM